MKSFSATGDNPLCGDTVSVFIEVEGDRIKRAQWEGYGCDLCLRCADALMGKLVGLSVDQVGSLTEQYMLDLLDHEEVGRNRRKCAILSLEATKKALALS